jgi:voltage-gated potassium channel
MSGSGPMAPGGRGSRKGLWAAVRDQDEVVWEPGRDGRPVEMIGACPVLSTSWELFILGISLLSLANIAVYALPIFSTYVRQVVFLADVFLTIPLFLDFIGRLRVAPDRPAYLTRGGGIIDFLGSLPIPVIRVLRVLRVVLVGRRLGQRGARGIVRALLRDPAAGTLLAVLLLTFVIMEVGSAVMLTVEEPVAGANITTPSDALWFSYETVTTVGYGDVYPVTDAGRLVGAVTLTLGIGVFAAFTGYLANVFLGGTPEAGFDGRWSPDDGKGDPEVGGSETLGSALPGATTGDPPGPTAADDPAPATRGDVAALRVEIAELRREVATLRGGPGEA